MDSKFTGGRSRLQGFIPWYTDTMYGGEGAARSWCRGIEAKCTPDLQHTDPSCDGGTGGGGGDTFHRCCGAGRVGLAGLAGRGLQAAAPPALLTVVVLATSVIGALVATWAVWVVPSASTMVNSGAAAGRG